MENNLKNRDENNMCSIGNPGVFCLQVAIMPLKLNLQGKCSLFNKKLGTKLQRFSQREDIAPGYILSEWVCGEGVISPHPPL